MPTKQELLAAAMATGDEEIIELAQQQVAEDVHSTGDIRQRPGMRRLPTWSLDALHQDVSIDDPWGSVPAGASGDMDTPGIVGRFVQRRTSLPYGTEPLDDATEEEGVVAKVVAGLSEDYQEAYYLVFGEGLSLSHAATELGLTKDQLRSKVETVKRRVKAALQNEPS